MKERLSTLVLAILLLCLASAASAQTAAPAAAPMSPALAAVLAGLPTSPAPALAPANPAAPGTAPAGANWTCSPCEDLVGVVLARCNCTYYDCAPCIGQWHAGACICPQGC